MVQRPAEFTAFEFVVLAGLRAAQLIRGCTPRVASTHKLIMTAQMEIAQRKVARSAEASVVPLDPTCR